MFDQAFIQNFSTPNRGAKHENETVNLIEFLSPQENNPKEPVMPVAPVRPAEPVQPERPIEPTGDDEEFRQAEARVEGSSRALFERRMMEYGRDLAAFLKLMDVYNQRQSAVAVYEVTMAQGGAYEREMQDYEHALVTHQEALMHKQSRVAEFNQTLAANSKKKALFEKERVRMFVCMLDSLSPLSLEQVSKEHAFVEVQRTFDPYGLYDLISKVHSAAGTMNKYEDQMKAWLFLLNLHMSKEEVTSLFCGRRFAASGQENLVRRLERLHPIVHQHLLFCLDRCWRVMACTNGDQPLVTRAPLEAPGQEICVCVCWARGVSRLLVAL
jgi:hypothetical protein